MTLDLGKLLEYAMALANALAGPWGVFLFGVIFIAGFVVQWWVWGAMFRREVYYGEIWRDLYFGEREITSKVTAPPSRRRG